MQESFLYGLSKEAILLIGIFGSIITVLWIILPFAVFNMRGNIEKQNKILESIESQLKFQNEQIKKTLKSLI